VQFWSSGRDRLPNIVFTMPNNPTWPSNTAGVAEGATEDVLAALDQEYKLSTAFPCTSVSVDPVLVLMPERAAEPSQNPDT
jgi:hypothetical protein